MKNNTPDSLLDQWLKGDLTMEQLYEKAAPLTKEEVTEQAQLHLATVNALKHAATIQKVRHIQKEFLAEQEAANKPVVPIKLNNNKWLLRIAATLLLLGTLYVLQSNIFVSSNTLYNNFFEDYYLTNERSREVADNGSIIELFRNGAYQGVIKTFDKLETSSNREKFLAGYAQLKSGNTGAAIGLFQKIIESNTLDSSKLYQDEAEYYLGLAYLQKGDKKEAYQMLNSIHQNKDHSYFNAVEKLPLYKLRWSSAF